MATCPFCQQQVAPASGICPHCNAPLSGLLPPADATLQQRVRELLEQNRKLDAVKLYRSETGASLSEAKNAVEDMDRWTTDSEADAPALEAEIVRMLQDGEKIAAVKYYRDATRVGLREAKEAIEEIGKRHGVILPGGGCASVLVLSAIASTIWLIPRLFA